MERKEGTNRRDSNYTDTDTRVYNTRLTRTLLWVATLPEGLELRLLDAHHLHQGEELHRVPPQVIVEVAHRLKFGDGVGLVG